MSHEHDWTGCPQGRHPLTRRSSRYLNRACPGRTCNQSRPPFVCLLRLVSARRSGSTHLFYHLWISHHYPPTQRALSVRQYLTEKFLHSSCVENPPGLLSIRWLRSAPKYLRCYARTILVLVVRLDVHGRLCPIGRLGAWSSLVTVGRGAVLPAVAAGYKEC